MTEQDTADIAVVDPHFHLWDQRKTPRKASPLVKLLGWRPGLMLWVARRVFPSDLYNFFGKPDHVLSDYLPDDYAEDARSRNLIGCVHVQAGWEKRGKMGPVGETRWLEALNPAPLKGIVGYADLALGQGVDAVLAAHVAASSRFRGVRYMLANHPDKGIHSFCEHPGQSRDAAWRQGYALLEKYDLSFDAWVYHHQLDEVAQLARDFPAIPIVLCHAGTPAGYGGAFSTTGREPAERSRIAEQWRASMQALAEHSNVSVKLSGLAMPCLGWGYHLGEAPSVQRLVDDLGPLIGFVIDTFGAERCMFASNFPVDKVSASWAGLFAAYAKIVASRTHDERAALFHGTATRVYRL